MGTAAKRKHRATYARDKKKGGYLIRVVGPNATEFAGREVPVETMNGEEHPEKLLRLITSGTDAGNEELGIKGTGLPYALYSFENKPKQAKEVEF